MEIQKPDQPDQVIAQIFVDSVVPAFVGTRERQLVHRLAEPELKEAIPMGFQVKTDVPKRLARSQLAEQQMEELVVTGEFPNMVIAVVALDTFVELILVDEVNHLREDVLTHNLATF